MTTIPYWFLIRTFLALFIGFWIASRLRGVLRAIVIRSMPVRYRMSEEYFNTQTRISMALAVAIGLSIAGLSYWGLGKARNAIKGPVVSRSSTVEIEPLPAPPPTPAPLKLASPPADSSANEEARPETYETPEPVRIQPPAPAPLRGPYYYLQLHAFLSETRAWNQKEYWAARLPLRKPTTKGILRRSSRAATFAGWARPIVYSPAGFQFCGKSSCSWLALWL
ncbi:MAG: hypothetical protein J5I94_25780 [Phaeodactylibacter sp.]|nr:hypothetical protein [Phaeodactylibacter sp.]